MNPIDEALARYRAARNAWWALGNQHFRDQAIRARADWTLVVRAASVKAAKR